MSTQPVNISTQTSSGKLTVNDQVVQLDRPGFPRGKTEVLARQSITVVQHKPQAFGKSWQIVFLTSGGQSLVVNNVKPEVGRQIMALWGIAVPA